MKFISRLSAAAAVIAALGMTACDSNDDNGGGNIETNNPNTGETPTTPVEEKKYIENTAVELKKVLNPQDQADFLNFCKDFSREFDGFINDDDYDYPYDYMARGVRDLGMSLRKGDLLGMTRAMQEISYSFSDIAGVYEPDFEEEEWVRTGDSKNLEYRFKVNGQNCSLTVAPSGGEWSASGEGWIEEDEYPYDEVKALIKVAVPRNVTLKLTQGSKTLMSGKVVSDYNQGGKTASCDVDATVANITLKAEADLNNTRCVAHAVATVGGTQVLEANGVLNGHDMCDFDRLMMIANGPDHDVDDDSEAWITSPYNIHSLFKDGTANTNIMRRMFVSGTCDNMAHLAYTFDNFEDENQGLAQTQVAYINDHIKAQFFLGGAKEPSGNIVWQLMKDVDEWNPQYTYWYAEPVLKFNSDGSTYTFEQYFNEDDFASTISVFTSIADLYEAFFGMNK